MASLGGRFLFDQPLQFDDGNILIGDPTTTIGGGPYAPSPLVPLNALIGFQSTIAVGSPSNVVCGIRIQVSGPGANTVLGNTLICENASNVVVGFFSNSHGSAGVNVGNFCTISARSDAAVLIGTSNTITGICPFSIGIGANLNIQSPNSIVMGDTSQIVPNMECSIALNGYLHNTNAANTKASIVLNGLVGDPVIGTPLLVTAQTGGNIAIGGIVHGNASVGCTAINGTIGIGSTGCLSIFGVLGENCISTINIGGGTADGLSESVAILGRATVSNEVIFGIHPTLADPLHGTSLFHAPSTLLDAGNNSIDLFKFNDTAVASAGDTSMFLLHKNGAGVMTISQVFASASAPAGSLLLYLVP